MVMVTSPMNRRIGRRRRWRAVRPRRSVPRRAAQRAAQAPRPLFFVRTAQQVKSIGKTSDWLAAAGLIGAMASWSVLASLLAG